MATDINLVEEPSWLEIFTLQGVDSDTNETRDDIQNWLYKDVKDINTRRVLTSYAILSRRLFENTFNEKRYQNLYIKREKEIINCIFFLGNTGDYVYQQDPLERLWMLRVKIYNTPIRKIWRNIGEINIPFEMKISKGLPLIELLKGCDFKIRRLDRYLKKMKRISKDERNNLSDEDYKRIISLYGEI
jgi:hypothetical protein